MKTACLVNVCPDVSGADTRLCGDKPVHFKPFSRRNNDDEYSWTALISKYTKCGQGRQALQLYEQMQCSGVQPSSYTFVALLKACSTLRDVENTRQIHAEVVRRGFATDVHVCTMLVNVYSVCRSLVDARLAFDSLPYRDVVAWNAMISGYAEVGNRNEAVQLYTRMQQEGVPPDERTCVCVLKAVRSSLAGFEESREGFEMRKRCLEAVRAIHRSIIKWKFDSALFVCNMLVDVYAKCGSLLEARHVFEKIPCRDVISWNAMLLGYVQLDKGEDALQLYSRMRHEGLIPDERTYVGVLKACSSLAAHEGVSDCDGLPLKCRSLEIVRTVHAKLRKQHYESDVFVGTMLVDVYMKCGSIEDARQVFERMPHRTVVSWNAIILGFAQMGQSEEALEFYTRMQMEHVLPDDRTYVGALRACSGITDLAGKDQGDGESVKQRCLQTVKSIHTDVVERGLESDVYVGTMLVEVYAKCGCLDLASGVFQRMPSRSVVTWNTIISGFAQSCECRKALHFYTQMRQEGVVPNGQTYVSALRACYRVADMKNVSADMREAGEGIFLESVRAIHTDVIAEGFESDMCVSTVLVESYAKWGCLEDALNVFHKMPHHDAVSWTAIILGYANRNMGAEALQLFAQMRLEGVTPSDHTYISVLKACARLVDNTERNVGDDVPSQQRLLVIVRDTHAEIVKRKFESDVYVGTMLIDVYGKCGSLEDAKSVFERMPHRHVASWTAMISSYVEMDEGEQALQLYDQMQMEGVVPNERTYVCALKACSTLAESGPQCDPMVDPKGVCLGTVRRIHAEVVKKKFETDLFVGNMLVDSYAKCGCLEDARAVFDNMPHPDVVSWNAMIWGCLQQDKSELALQYYNQMRQGTVVPDDRTFLGALKACGCLAGLPQGRDLHAQILHVGSMNLFLASALIEMYGKCGSMSDALEVFSTLQRRDIVTWSALIAGFASHGESEMVFELLERMKHDGIQPNSVTFLSVLTVCSHVGELDKGQKYFELMTRDYGIIPTIKHFTCLVDLLGRSGQLEKLLEVVKAIPLKPDSALWECVLAACQKWSNVELGRIAFEAAVSLENNNAAVYVLMSNIFTACHMHKEAKEVHEMRIQSRTWKQPGQSQWMDTKGTLHQFAVGDRRYIENHELSTQLGILEAKISYDACIGTFGGSTSCEVVNKLRSGQHAIPSHCLSAKYLNLLRTEHLASR